MEVYSGSLTDKNGNLITGATVTVKDKLGNIVSLFTTSAGDVAKANPFTTSSDGLISFAAADGTYDMTTTGIDRGVEFTYTTEISLFDPAGDSLFSSNPVDIDKGIRWQDIIGFEIFNGLINRTPQLFITLAGQVAFTLSTAVSSASVISVYINGERLNASSGDYTLATDGITVTLAESYPTGSELYVIAYEVDSPTSVISDIPATGYGIPWESGVGRVDTYTELRALASISNLQMVVGGRSTIGDGGWGIFRWDSSDRSADVTTDTLSGIYVAPNSDLTGASGCWVRQVEGSYRPEWFGTGTSDDLLVIQACATVAGANAVIDFPAGQTLISSGTLYPLAGQEWRGNGATLKRADELFTTLTSGVTGGGSPGTVSVASTTGFYVGQTVSFKSSTIAEDSAGSAGELRTWSISAVGAGTITLVGGSLVKSYVSGDYLVTSGPIVSAYLVDDIKVHGFTFDGNNANNTLWRRWEMTASLYMVTDNLVVEDNLFINASSDAVQVGGTNIRVEGNRIQDCWDNGIHLTGSTLASIKGNYISNVNIGKEIPGHADGAILASNQVRKTSIVGNFITTCNGYPAIGSFGDEQNSDLLISDNHIIDTIDTAKATRSCIEVTSSTDYQNRVVISNNRIINGGVVYIQGAVPSYSAGALTGTFGVVFSGNYLEKTGMYIYNAYGTVVTGNTFLGLQDPAYNAGTGPNKCLLQIGLDAHQTLIADNVITDIDGSLIEAIVLMGTSYVTIRGNKFNDFGAPIRFYNAGATVPIYVDIVDNTFTNPIYHAIQMFARSGSYPAAGTGVVIARNKFYHKNPNIAYNHVVSGVGSGVVVDSNIFDVHFKMAGSNYCMVTSSYGNGAIIKGNKFIMTKDGGVGDVYAVQNANAGDMIEYNYSNDTTPTGGVFRDLSAAATLTNNRIITIP